MAQALIFLIGGFDTSGSTLTWTTVELAYDQQVQVENNLFKFIYLLFSIYFNDFLIACLHQHSSAQIFSSSSIHMDKK